MPDAPVTDGRATRRRSIEATRPDRRAAVRGRGEAPATVPPQAVAAAVLPVSLVGLRRLRGGLLAERERTTGSGARSAWACWPSAAALVAWGKYLMPRGPFEEPRQLMADDRRRRRNASSPTSPSRGTVAIKRRGFLVKCDGRGGGRLRHRRALPAAPLARATAGQEQLYKTTWRKGSYLTTIDGERVKVSDVDVGGIMTVFPERRRRRRALPDGAHPRPRRREHRHEDRAARAGARKVSWPSRRSAPTPAARSVSTRS